ncbi:MAG: type II toxin-antitoxin system Phd/YefM family antitoxin [bacterium]|nr:type II toxin-antitoxin system Phd/YefM family antitoxin [bacterium]
MVSKRRRRLKMVNAFSARTHLGRIIKLASEGERFILTKRGKPEVAIIGVEDLEDLLEIAAEQEDKELQAALRESARQYRRGEVSSLNALRTIYAGRR